MSRIAKNPVALPQDVEASVSGQVVTVKGPKGQVSYVVHDLVEVVLEGSELKFSPKNGGREAKALSGTMRSIVNNMVHGVHQGYEKKLQLVGVGYRAQAQGKVLNLTLGFSHPVVFEAPEGVTIETPTQTEIVVKGIDKQVVGQVAANIRRYRPPEPYKGKGVRYADEQIVLKEAKKK